MTESGGGGPGEAQEVFQDPANTQQLLEMHQAGTPFLDMAAKMGVTVSPEYSKLVAAMSDAEVKIIRDAMVQALQRNERVMPFHCQLQGATPPSITVTAAGSATNLLARIDPA